MQNPRAKQAYRASMGRRIFNIVVYLFAIAGFGIISAWAVFKLGLTNNKGAVDEYRHPKLAWTRIKKILSERNDQKR